MTISSDRLRIEEDRPLAPLTTLGVGGPARFFIQAVTEEEILAAFSCAIESELPVFVLGGGSNIVVSDEGFPGLVIQIALKGIAYESHGGLVTVTAAAGEDWDGLVAACVRKSLAGIECLSGIPGYVGGTPVQNVGAYGQEVSETITKVRCIDRQSMQIVDLSKEDCHFSYRTSIFNSTHKDRYTVLSVNYALRIDGPPKLAYKDLADHFGDRPVTLSEVREAVLKIRRQKSMVIDPDDPNSRSAGSFFKNPIVSAELFEKLSSQHDGRVPGYRANEGTIKIPAAWLIENAGFAKGFRMGNAGISSNHSLAIVNLGGASAAEIVMLMESIQTGVAHRFGIHLRPEPVFVGFSG